MRVAVTQFATNSTTQDNLATCLRMINAAAVCRPSLIVLPQYCNTSFCDELPCYTDHNQAWQEALIIDGVFLQGIAEQAKTHECYIVINVSLQQDSCRDHQDGTVKSNISVTCCLFSPSGLLIHQQDKQALSGYENVFFTRGPHVAKVITTADGKLGLLSGNDTMTFDSSRGLATAGAQLLCNTMNAFSIDQTHLHNAARACENKVFVASANKIGKLAHYGTIQESLVGVGHSQIISAEGRVLAKLNHDEEGFIFADIDLIDTNIAQTEVGLNHKTRPDGTRVSKQFRPELYRAITASTTAARADVAVVDAVKEQNVPLTANVAIFATYKANEEAINDVCYYIENNLSDIIQLPELFFVTALTNTSTKQERAKIAQLSEQLVKQVSAVLRPFQYLCTSIIIDDNHQAVIISEQGIFATQQQLHACQRYQWTGLGDKVNIIELPLEQGNIKLAMLTADDANIAEIVKVATLQNIHLLLVPFDIQEPCEVRVSLLSRAVENRICIVAASREKSFAAELSAEFDENNIYSKNKVKPQKSTGLIINLTTDMTLLPQWKSPKFIGYINEPRVKQQYGKITKAVIHPFAAAHKLKVININKR